MEKSSKNVTGAAAAMTPRASRSKNQETSKYTENFNPNLLSQSQHQSPGSKTLIPNPKSSSSSPVVSKSCSVKKSQKHKNPNNNSPKNKIRQRKFVVAKKKQKKDENQGHGAGSSCNCKEKKEGDAAGKCPCVAYENLRKSQEEFFKNRHRDDEEEGEEEAVELETVLEQQLEQEEEKQGLIVKRNRERLMEEGRESVTITQIGSGKVMSLIKAFENLLSEPPISKDQDHQENEHKVMEWPPSNLTLTSQNLGLDPPASVSSSWDSTRESSVSTRTSNGGRRSRRNSLESSTTLGGGRRWKKKQQKVTSLRPFKLRTEQRGKLKEEEFVKKIQEIMTEEEKQRIPIAQGLPWTTDEPES